MVSPSPTLTAQLMPALPGRLEVNEPVQSYVQCAAMATLNSTERPWLMPSGLASSSVGGTSASPIPAVFGAPAGTLTDRLIEPVAPSVARVGVRVRLARIASAPGAPVHGVRSRARCRLRTPQPSVLRLDHWQVPASQPRDRRRSGHRSKSFSSRFFLLLIPEGIPTTRTSLVCQLQQDTDVTPQCGVGQHRFRTVSRNAVIRPARGDTIPKPPNGRTMWVQPAAAPAEPALRPGPGANPGHACAWNIEPYRWDARAKPSLSGGVPARLAPPVAPRAPFDRRERGIRDPPTGKPVVGTHINP